METLKIKIPEGYEIDSLDKLTGQISFKQKPKHVTERIKTVEDLLAANGWDPNEFEEKVKNMSEDEKAFVVLKLLAKTLNEGWVPDWDNHSETKYYPWFEMGGSSGFRLGGCVDWASHSYVGSRLCFKSKELAMYAGEQFIDVYKKFMIL